MSLKEKGAKKINKIKRPSSRMVKRVRTKIQEEIDETCVDIDNKFNDLNRILGIKEVDDDFPPMVEGRYYYLKSDNVQGVYLLEKTVFGASIFHLFKHVVTNVAITYSIYTIKFDMEECEMVSREFVEEYKKKYDEEMLVADWAVFLKNNPDPDKNENI